MALVQRGVHRQEVRLTRLARVNEFRSSAKELALAHGHMKKCIALNKEVANVSVFSCNISGPPKSYYWWCSFHFPLQNKTDLYGVMKRWSTPEIP